jgi:hypothetical protein
MDHPALRDDHFALVEGWTRGEARMITELPKLWTEKQVAEMYGLNPETLARLRRARQMPYTRIGKKIRYTAAHIAAYLELQECASTSSPVRASGKSAGQTILDGPSADRAALEIGRKQRPNLPGTR